MFLYCFEFCYFANFLSVIFFVFYPNNKNVWFMIWASDCGILALAMVVLGNKIVIKNLNYIF